MTLISRTEDFPGAQKGLNSQSDENLDHKRKQNGGTSVTKEEDTALMSDTNETNSQNQTSETDT